jgi:hypothetical protein
MAIDARIPLGVQPLQLQMPSPDAGINQLARVMQLQGMQDERAMSRLKMDEYQRGLADQNALREALTTGQDPYNALLKIGNVKGATEYRNAEAERKSKEATASKAEAEALAKRTSMYRDALAGVSAPEHAAAWLQAQYKDPVLGPVMQSMSPYEQAVARIPTEPAQFSDWLKQQALGMGEFLKANAPKYQKQDSGQVENVLALPGLGGAPSVVSSVQKVADPNALLSADTARRGQNMVDARARERLEFDRNQPKGQIVETAGGYVVADPRAATTVPLIGADGKQVKGKAADRQLTDAQAKANLFGSRMAESHRILTDLEGKYSPLAVNAKMGAADVPIVGGVAGYAGNLMLTDQGQQAEQAQRDFINAVLRRESGAVISKPEFANGQKQYFPQPGDSNAVLDQKRRNRELAIKGMAAEVPGGLRSAPSLTTPQGGTDPAIDELLKKYGGN